MFQLGIKPGKDNRQVIFKFDLMGSSYTPVHRERQPSMFQTDQSFRPTESMGDVAMKYCILTVICVFFCQKKTTKFERMSLGYDLVRKTLRYFTSITRSLPEDHLSSCTSALRTGLKSLFSSLNCTPLAVSLFKLFSELPAATPTF